MRECAFCPSTAKMTAEHITSEWMSRLFPGEKAFKSTDRFGNVREWTDHGLDIKAKVLCGPCNNKFGIIIEANRAIPTMTPLMLGNIHAPFGKEEAHSLAIFAFKSAVVVDYAQRHRAPFFSRRLRHAFRNSFFIPNNVNMFLAPYVPANRRLRWDYRVSLTQQGELGVGTGYDVQLGIYTFGFAALAFQVVANKQIYAQRFVPLPTCDHLAIPFWPILPSTYKWPGVYAIRSFEELIKFHERWNTVAPV